jgi:DNA-binding NarL/FixJ family response regulator
MTPRVILPPESEAGVSRAQFRVGIIDDHELVRQGLRSLLVDSANAGVDVVYCGQDPRECAAMGIDVALLDVDLGSGSLEVEASVTLLVEAGAAVLLISAFEDARAIRQELAAGALGFVPKRVSFEVLQEALATVAGQELYLSVDLASILAAAVDTPDLSPRELDALRLYASGLSMTAVGRKMGISPHTAKEYLDRVRTKYAAVGRTARTRTELYAAARSDGLLPGT